MTDEFLTYDVCMHLDLDDGLMNLCDGCMMLIYDMMCYMIGVMI